MSQTMPCGSLPGHPSAAGKPKAEHQRQHGKRGEVGFFTCLEPLPLLLRGVQRHGGDAQPAQQRRQPPRGRHRVHKHQRAPRVLHLRRRPATHLVSRLWRDGDLQCWCVGCAGCCQTLAQFTHRMPPCLCCGCITSLSSVLLTVPRQVIATYCSTAFDDMPGP